MIGPFILGPLKNMSSFMSSCHCCTSPFNVPFSKGDPSLIRAFVLSLVFSEGRNGSTSILFMCIHSSSGTFWGSNQ